MCVSVLSHEKYIALTALHYDLVSLKNTLKSRLEDNFFGSTVGNNLKNFGNYQQNKFISCAREIYSRVLF